MRLVVRGQRKGGNRQVTLSASMPPARQQRGCGRRGGKQAASGASALELLSPYGNPLPLQLHATLSSAGGLKPGRVIIVGDVVRALHAQGGAAADTRHLEVPLQQQRSTAHLARCPPARGFTWQMRR